MGHCAVLANAGYMTDVDGTETELSALSLAMGQVSIAELLGKIQTSSPTPAPFIIRHAKLGFVLKVYQLLSLSGQ